MTIRQLTPPESEPVTLEQAKGFVRVDTDADDALLSLLITAARQEAEAITGRALGESTWAVSLPSLSGMLEVPLVPCTELVGAAVDDELFCYEQNDSSFSCAVLEFFIYFAILVRKEREYCLRCSIF